MGQGHNSTQERGQSSMQQLPSNQSTKCAGKGVHQGIAAEIKAICGVDERRASVLQKGKRHYRSDITEALQIHYSTEGARWSSGIDAAIGAAVRVPYTTSPCSDLGQVVNLSLSVA